MSPRTPTNSNVVELDFTGIGGKRDQSSHVPEGDYLFVVTRAQAKVKGGHEDLPSAKQSKRIEWVLKIIAGPGRGQIVHNTSTQLPDKKPSEYLWRTRAFLDDLFDGAKQTVEGKAKYNLDGYKGMRIAGLVTDDDPYTNPETGITTYKSKVASQYRASEYIAQFGEPSSNNDASSSAAASDDDADDDEDVATGEVNRDGDDDDADDLDDLDVAEL